MENLRLQDNGASHKLGNKPIGFPSSAASSEFLRFELNLRVLTVEGRISFGSCWPWEAGRAFPFVATRTYARA